eukprot:767299-Hanusia_phi.AAC.1
MSQTVNCPIRDRAAAAWPVSESDTVAGTDEPPGSPGAVDGLLRSAAGPGAAAEDWQPAGPAASDGCRDGRRRAAQSTVG